MESKIFTELNDEDAQNLHEFLIKVGFRRSQDIIYRPNCETCSECKSVRIPSQSFIPNKTQRRLIRLNSGLYVTQQPNKATEEQYILLSKYLSNRHAEGGMADMTFDDYRNMVECNSIKSSLIEYRLPTLQDNGQQEKSPLIGVALTDIMDDSLSMVYSFYAVGEEYKKRSLGTYMVLDHIARARLTNKDYVYLGYWVKDSPKMAYKTNFHPLEKLDKEGWAIIP